MEAKELFNNRFFLERLLGRGNFSEVWLAQDTKTTIKVALKIYAPATGLDDAGLDVFAREFSLVVHANHKNLLKPLYYDSYDRKPFLVLPYCERGSIMKDAGKMSENDAWRLLRDVASGLAWLHNMNPPVIHQDIKPDNVMIGENGEFLITDFGVSTHVKSTLRKSMSAAFSSAGTIAYMAPERFSKESTPIMANDIYSLGATVFEMLTGDTPFGDDGGLIQMKGAEVPELKGDYSPQLKEVVDRCLRTNPWERPTAEQLEKYAEAGLNGHKIRFVGDKSFLEKHKIIILIGGVLLGLTVSFSWLHIKKQQKIYDEIRTREYNDSIKTVMDTHIYRGDSLANVGALHDEGYELSLLEAYKNYAMALSYKMKDGTAPIDLSAIEHKIQETEIQLYNAYVSFIEKAEIFSDEEDIATEFNERAKVISDVIDIAKYNKSESPNN